jgi:trans-aconitate 2-methyltransferase
MLERARAADPAPRLRFVQADLRDFAPDAPLDRIVSNAALQWVGDHAALLERFAGWLAPGGALAVQMPDNDAEPTHRILAELWRDPRFAPRLGDPPAERRVQPAPGTASGCSRSAATSRSGGPSTCTGCREPRTSSSG